MSESQEHFTTPRKHIYPRWIALLANRRFHSHQAAHMTQVHATRCTHHSWLIPITLAWDKSLLMHGMHGCTLSDVDRDIRHLYTQRLLEEATEESICHGRVTRDTWSIQRKVSCSAILKLHWDRVHNTTYASRQCKHLSPPINTCLETIINSQTNLHSRGNTHITSC
jgi:hypothetical protein